MRNLLRATGGEFEDGLKRLFTLPEEAGSPLHRLEQHLSADLAEFLKTNIVAIEKPLPEIEKDFARHTIPDEPGLVAEYAKRMMSTLVAHAVHTSSPEFIGHMTSALPNFLLPISKVMAGLNQNVVKVETSKAFTPMERQVLGMLHHLVYGMPGEFYRRWMHNGNHALGSFCSGGTVANLTALWVARNRLLKPDGQFRGVGQEGMYRALKHYGFEGLAVVVSERGHYSFQKAVNILGLGSDALVKIETDANYKVKLDHVRRVCADLRARNIAILALVGVAGSTETGSVDPLEALADVAAEYKCHYHVDAAWGGATLLSDNHKHLLRGIERADSATVDAHKQMYVPMGAGMVVFKDPTATSAIEHHSDYVLRRGSKDLGSQTLEGSRNGMAMLVHACFEILGRKGYGALIDRSIGLARSFAGMIKESEDFELISEPELCLLTYRYVPAVVQQAMEHADAQLRGEFNAALNDVTKFIQRRQWEDGRTFVSRTRLTPEKYGRQDTLVFRVVLANPLTTRQVLEDVLAEQRALAASDRVFLPRLLKMAGVAEPVPAG